MNQKWFVAVAGLWICFVLAMLAQPLASMVTVSQLPKFPKGLNRIGSEQTSV